MNAATQNPSEMRKVKIAIRFGHEDAKTKLVPTASGTRAGLHHNAMVIPWSANSEITATNGTELRKYGVFDCLFDINSLHADNDISECRTSTITGEVLFSNRQSGVVGVVFWYVISDPSPIDVASNVLREIDRMPPAHAAVPCTSCPNADRIILPGERR